MRKVLVSAFACRPGRGSEPGTGWNWVQQIARFNEVWVITQADNRESIESVLESGTLTKVHWVYFDTPGWNHLWRLGVIGECCYYYLWQVLVYFLARKLHRVVHFDIVQHVTMVMYWMPSFLSLLPVPFVWGPVGGGEEVPSKLVGSFSFPNRVYEFLRHIVHWLGRHDPFVRITARRSRLALSMTPQKVETLTRLGCRNVKVLFPVGLSEDELEVTEPVRSLDSRPFRIVCAGSLLEWKGFHLALRAYAEFHADYPDSELWVIGNGPEWNRLLSSAAVLGVLETVHFWGRTPRDRVMEMLPICDVLVHPTLHDSGSCICVEAMAAGLPVICLATGGPATSVTDETGIRVPPASPGEVVHGISTALETLARNPELLLKMSEAARKRVLEHYTWNRHGVYLQSLYETIISGRQYAEKYENPQ